MINATDSKGTFYKLNQKEGIPIVFIHGVGLDHNIWDPQINEFDNTVLIYDILGHGRTPLNKEKIRFSRSKVGDRYVKEKMKKLNYNLGGEQSGHIILGKFATTGDGLLVALEILFSLRKGKKASQLLKVFKPLPQILENIVVQNKNVINNDLDVENEEEINEDIPSNVVYFNFCLQNIQIQQQRHLILT